MTQLFPLFTDLSGFAFSVTDRENRTGPVRTVRKYELELYTADGGTTYLSDVAYPIRRGTALLAKPGDRRYTVGNLSCLYVHFDCRDAEFARERLDSLPRTVSLSGSYRSEALFERLGGLFPCRSRTAELRTESILLELLAEYAEAAEEAETAPKRYRVYREQIDGTLDYMKRHYPEAFSSALLAGRIHLSVNFFQTVFRELVGIPPARYLRQLRVESACRMLADTDLPLSEIAERNGFASPAYLTASFRAAKGITPSEYRKQSKL